MNVIEVGRQQTGVQSVQSAQTDVPTALLVSVYTDCDC